MSFRTCHPESWELAKRDAMFILASFYRPMPVCLFCRKFSDGVIDCGEHGDFDADDRQDVISIDSTDAIMVGKYPQSSTHSFDWEPRQGVVSGMELPSLRDSLCTYQPTMGPIGLSLSCPSRTPRWAAHQPHLSTQLCSLTSTNADTHICLTTDRESPRSSQSGTPITLSTIRPCHR